MKNTPTIRVVSFLTGGFLVFMGLLAFAAIPFLRIAVADAEWSRMANTGTPSHPEKFTWSEWRPNDGSVTLMPSEVNEKILLNLPSGASDLVTEYRVGTAKVFLWDYKVCQGRFGHEDSAKILGANRPGLGVEVHAIAYLLYGLAIALGAVLVIWPFRAAFGAIDKTENELTPAPQ